MGRIIKFRRGIVALVEYIHGPGHTSLGIEIETHNPAVSVKLEPAPGVDPEQLTRTIWTSITAAEVIK